MWAHFYADGGFGMYPITLFGLLFAACAGLVALRPERERLPLLLSLAALTAFSGVLGFSLGIISTCRHVQTLPAETQLTVLVTGIAESFNMVVLASMLLLFGTLLCSAASLRVRLANERG